MRTSGFAIPPRQREYTRVSVVVVCLVLACVGVLSGACYNADGDDLADLTSSQAYQGSIPGTNGGGPLSVPGTGGVGNAATGTPTGAANPPPDVTGAGLDASAFNCGATFGTQYHPAGYAAAGVHGLESKLQTQECRNCHGGNLEGCGTAAPSCDNCHDGGHAPGWRTNCTYCHGGQGDTLGAPPRDLDPARPASALSFLSHSVHVGAQRHAPYDCSQCHVKPTDMLSPGHAVDTTPGQAEVYFGEGLSTAAAYDGNGTCTNLYCHGSGRQLGDSVHTEGAQSCDSCHAHSTHQGLSSNHARHVGSKKLPCSDCHGTVEGAGGVIVGPDGHVNGQIELKMDTSYNPATKTCSGFCHTAHFNFKW